MRHCLLRIANLLRLVALTILLPAIGTAAQATLITFDERPRQLGPDGDTAWYVDPVTTEYQNLGVVFNDGYLLDGPSPMNASQSLMGGPFFSIQFVGALPQYVSLHFTSTNSGSQATVTSVAGDASFAVASTGGYYWGGPDLGLVQDKPFVADSVASFHSMAGISALYFDTFAVTRNIGWIDSLYFGNVAPVPEPGSLALMAAGIGVIGWARRRRFKA